MVRGFSNHLNNEGSLFMRDLEKILEEYLSACIKNGKYLDKGDPKNANKQFRILVNIKTDLNSNQGYGLDKLLPYLEFPNEYVRLHTASIVIPIAPERAKDVLGELSQKRGNIGFTAKMTLSEWEKGNLKFDF